MPVAFFRTTLSLQVAGGQAQLLAPEALRGLDYQIVIARDGGEAIVRVEAPAKTLEQIAEDQAFTRLAPKEAEKLRESYPPPRLKRRYRLAPPDETGVEHHALDAEGNPLVETVQTVRAGFHLVDLPLTAEGARG
jgi:hypothetical protein